MPQKKKKSIFMVVGAALLLSMSLLLLFFELETQEIGQKEQVDNADKSLTSYAEKDPIMVKPELENHANVPNGAEGKPLREAILEIEKKLEARDAIKHLNDNSLNHAERAEISEQLNKLNELRSKDVEQQLTEIQNAIAALESIHTSRLRSYGIQKP